ncbi:MAG: hypothetical protein A2V90_00630 [Gammaproteobacteria bacterium RBG_16_57_12]|nr:MAG: hypothetical protein A2V90_00630 [Gammaproteobacteria bacterium RBG_16_57_12]
MPISFLWLSFNYQETRNSEDAAQFSSPHKLWSLACYTRILYLELLALKGRWLISTGFQFQITHQANTAFLMQCFMYILDGSQNLRQFTFNISARGMCLKRKIILLK